MTGPPHSSVYPALRIVAVTEPYRTRRLGRGDAGAKDKMSLGRHPLQDIRKIHAEGAGDRPCGLVKQLCEIQTFECPLTQFSEGRLLVGATHNLPFVALARGDVLHDAEARLVPAEMNQVAHGLHVHDGAILLAMAPFTGKPLRLRIGVIAAIRRRGCSLSSNIQQGQPAEFLLGKPIERDRSIVYPEELEALQIVDIHRKRMAGEQEL